MVSKKVSDKERDVYIKSSLMYEALLVSVLLYCMEGEGEV